VDRIKECPFCGDIAELRQHTYSNKMLAYVECTHCMARGPNYMDIRTLGGTFEEGLDGISKNAIEQWNEAKRWNDDG
jgi:Restriction alleviation protein Lar